MTFHTLMPGAFGKAGNPLTVRKLAGAWFIRQPATVDGVVVDERRGLGTDRAPLPLRALSLNGSNQYGWIDMDQVDYPFTMFGFGKKSGTVTKSAMSVSDPSNSSRFFSVGFDDGDTVAIQRRNTTDILNTQAVPLVSGWYSFVFVCLDATTVIVYRNGALLHTFSGLTSVPVGVGFTRYAIGSFRSSSPGSYWDGELSHCGFLRRAATLEDAQIFDETGIISGAEKLFPLDNNSTTVSYNIGSSASWWLSEPRRNTLGYSEATVSQLTQSVEVVNAAGFLDFNNSLEFATTPTTTSYAYLTTTLSSGVQATLSVYVKTADGNPPTFGNASASHALNPFALNIRWSIINPTTYTVSSVGSGVYRVSAVGTTGANGSNCGVLKYPTNTAASFQTTGFQLELGSSLSDYQPVIRSGVEFPAMTLVNSPTSYTGQDVRFSRQILSVIVLGGIC